MCEMKGLQPGARGPRATRFQTLLSACYPREGFWGGPVPVLCGRLSPVSGHAAGFSELPSRVVIARLTRAGGRQIGPEATTVHLARNEGCLLWCSRALG